MTLYELNQSGYKNLPTMDSKQIEKACKNIITPFLTAHSSNYYLLLNNDAHYYTFFVFNEFSTIENLVDELIGLVKELGPIKSIETDSSGEALEFWIEDGEIVNAFMFFDYARGVIEIP